MKKVLIISYIFPPVNMIASKRYGTMCKYFEENGYIPYVLTTKHDEIIGTGIRCNCELPIDKSQIIRIGSVRNSIEVQGFAWKCVFKLLNDWNYYSRTIESSGIGWFNQVKKEINLEKFKDIDAVIGTFPPMTNLFVALYLSKKLKIPFIAEVRDLISDYLETPIGYKRLFWVDKVIERNILQRAAAIITVTSGFKNILKSRYPAKKIAVIYNGWDKEILHRKDMQEIQEEKYLYYAGTLYPHRVESFHMLVKYLKKINKSNSKKIKFIIRSNGPVDLNVRIKNIVRQEGMSEYVHILAAANENVIQREQDKAYINVVLSSLHSEDKALMTTVPGKVYELLKEKAPILAILPEDSDVAKVLNYTNKGIASVNEMKIIDFIIKENNFYVGNQKINFFSRRIQAKRLCEFMDQLLVE